MIPGILCRKNGEPTDGNGVLHLHSELEFCLITDGEAEISVDGIKSTLQTGDVFLVFPNQIHAFRTKCRTTFTAFYADPDWIPELSTVLETEVSTDPVIRNAGNDPSIREPFASLSRAYSEKADNPYRESLCKGYLLILLSGLLAKCSVVPAPAGDDRALRAIVSYCTEHYSEEISLGVLEEKIHLNRYYISHLFSGKLGVGLNDYVNSLRVSEACKRLSASDAGIAEIGKEVGFNTMRTFNRAFIRQTGISPSEYRKKNKASSYSGVKR